MKRKIRLIASLFLVMITLFALFAPLVTPFSYEEQNIEQQLLQPNSTHWMGTDLLGRDLYSRIIYGSRLSLAVGAMTTLFALFIGTIAGVLSGYFGGKLDQVIMRVTDFFYTFPMILTAILFTLLFGRGLIGLFLAIGFSSWITQARLVRGQILQIKQLSYIEAAHALGQSEWNIVFKHVLPQLRGTIVIALAFQIPTNILTESFLSFMGLGLSPPFASWGTLAHEGYQAMLTYPHLIIFPGLALFLAMLSLQILADALRDSYDPKKNLEKSFLQ